MLVPSSLFHAGHVPGDRPHQEAGYVGAEGNCELDFTMRLALCSGDT
jgi:hypothetical protein